MIDYSIISISNRAAENVLNIRRIVEKWNELTDNRVVNGRKENAFSILRNMGFVFDYSPDDGRIDPMMATEAGAFASHILAMKNALNHESSVFVIFEDDALLSNDFIKILNKSMSDLPDDWDFLSMTVAQQLNIETNESIFGSQFIHKCLKQPSYLACMIYSRNGMNKFIEHVLDIGIYYNIDSMIYRASHRGVLNGYILRNAYSYAVTHNPHLIVSDIDPIDARHTL